MTSIASSKHLNRAATYVRAAIAVELLLTCSMRRENLIRLELGYNIRRIGSDGDDRWILEFDGEDVKNAEPLRYTLPRESADLLEEYLDRWRPILSEIPSPWLFPAPDGSCMVARHLAGDINKRPKESWAFPLHRISFVTLLQNFICVIIPIN